VLGELPRRVKALAAEGVYVETDNYRNAAFSLYEAMGFTLIHEVLVFRKDMHPKASV